MSAHGIVVGLVALLIAAGPLAATAQASKTPPKAGGGIGDGLTAQRVRHQMLVDLRFDPSHVKVVSSSGRVALNGTVKTAKARLFAQADASKVAAVHQVINRLKVVP